MYNEFVGPLSSHCPREVSSKKKCGSVGQLLATWGFIRLARDLNLRPTAPVTSALSLDQMVGHYRSRFTAFQCFPACDVTAFPGDGGANNLDANVPAVLPIGVTVPYFCTGALQPNGITENTCDIQGNYMTPIPTCEAGR